MPWKRMTSSHYQFISTEIQRKRNLELKSYSFHVIGADSFLCRVEQY